MVKLVECPRDAMQGIQEYIPASTKAAYINQLLKVGFETIDFGSFVSPKAIPQMRDTAEVLSLLQLDQTNTKLSAIVANKRGAVDAAKHSEIDYLGYPFSVSETFQLRNTNSTIEESLERVEEIQNICIQSNKQMLVYLSMGFGNPYGDEWNVEIVQKWVDKLANMDIKLMALSDTIGVSNPNSISYLFSHLIPPYPDVVFGAHLHTNPATWEEKIAAAYENGCLRFDSAMLGYGGCPMAKDELVGNMPTEPIVQYFKKLDETFEIDMEAFHKALEMAKDIFLH